MNNLKIENFYNKKFTFSGFRDNNLSNKLKNNFNIEYEDSINENSNYLVINDIDEPYYSAKRKLAYKYNIPIIEKHTLINIINNS